MTREQFLAWEQSTYDTLDVKRCYIDAAGSDLVAGILLSQIVYWHLPSREGHERLQVERDGARWLAKGREDWWEECRITAKQFDRAAQHLEALGIIETSVKRFHGNPTKHIRLLWDVLFTLVTKPRETTPGGQLSSSSPGFVYLLRTPAGHYKIGKARDIHARLTQIAPALPFPVTLEHQIACDDYTHAERSLHERFASRRLHGEWFGLTEADVTWIKALSRWPQETKEEREDVKAQIAASLGHAAPKAPRP